MMAQAKPTDAVQYFVPEHPALPQTLRGRLHAEISSQIVQLAGGYAQDWSDYKKRIGTIEGLKRAVNLCEEIEEKMNR